MKKEIFPKEILDDSVEVHQFTHSTRSKVIYGIFLALILSLLVALPFLYVDVYVSARGIVIPEEKRISIAPIQSGRVVFVDMTNNQNIEKGDTLVVIEDPVFDEKWSLLTTQIERTTMLVSDIEHLLARRVTIKSLQSSEYKAAFALYRQGLFDLQTKFQKVSKDHERDSLLFSKGVISRVDYEQSQYKVDLSTNDIGQWKRRHASDWQIELAQQRQLLTELQSSQKQLEDSKDNNLIIAPTSGTLLEVVGLDTNSVIHAGQRIAEISPSSDLVVECYLAPTDIGYLQPGNPADFKIDAFNYNQWGMAHGQVITIGEDVELIDNNPIFKLRCSIENPTLRLKNGAEGKLKKGMTLTAQFVLTERSLFDLLYDKIDDWLNPSQKHKSWTK